MSSRINIGYNKKYSNRSFVYGCFCFYNVLYNMFFSYRKCYVVHQKVCTTSWPLSMRGRSIITLEVLFKNLYCTHVVFFSNFSCKPLVYLNYFHYSHLVIFYYFLLQAFSFLQQLPL